MKEGSELKKQWKKKIVLILVLLAAIMIGSGMFYVNDYYHADTTAIDVIEEASELVSVHESPGKQIVFQPENPIAGLIFYPGGKVEYEAYAPLMKALAEKQILCVLVHMPCNLAVLDMNAADGITKDYPEIEQWYMVGHSLGGAMAADYVSKHDADYQGVILLAAYSTVDIHESGLRVLSIYGSKDGVMNRESFAKYQENLPSDAREYVIEGGCHSYFGFYGKQKNDGEAGITRKEQIDQTVSIISEWVKHN